MRVALIYPAIAVDGFRSAGAPPPKTGWINHGLCYISSALKEKGHRVSLIDLRQLSAWDELPGLIRKISPDIAAITIMSVDFDAALKAARITKEVDNRIKVVVGGPHPSLMEEELIGNPDIDLIFKGEAEITFPAILEDIVNGNLKSRVITGEMPDLDTIPFVDRALFPILEAPISPFLKMPFVTTIAGRGCTYNCSFCQPAERLMFGRKVRRMSVGRLIDELEITRRRSAFNSLMIHDDCLVEDIRWIEEFLRLYRKSNFPRSFVCQSRADIIVKNPSLFREMRKQGLEMLLIGFESGSQRILNFLRKGTTVEQNYKAARICRKLGIRVWANFMLGIPTETKEEALETIRMVKRINPYVASPAFYTPHPGSDLFKLCLKNDLSLIRRHEDYRRDPAGCKIKNVDYDFLKAALAEISKESFFMKTKRKIDRMKVHRFNKELIRKTKEPVLV